MHDAACSTHRAKLRRSYRDRTASLPYSSPAERRRTTLRAAALSSCADELLSGNTAPRPRPGDLTAAMRPNPV